jgi:hypothetical protein
MPITGHGWELHVNRLGLQSHGGVTRTYSTYQAHLDGVAVANLFGHICECTGKGDNSTEDNGKRVEAGRYPLHTQFGRYRTMGYSMDLSAPAIPHMPGLLLFPTGKREGILIHPGHPPPPRPYLSSIGCLNPTKPLASGDSMDFFESRTRVIALIDSLHAFSPQSFHMDRSMPIANAAVVIDGEPMNALADPPPSEAPLVS